MTIALGLWSRSGLGYIPEFIELYAGDALWALLIFWLVCLLRPNSKTLSISIMALILCYSVELSQLYHAPWIDGIRRNRLGGLVLGFGFKWSDIVLYTVGVSVGAMINESLKLWRSK